MKKIYFCFLFSCTAIICSSQKKWIGPANGGDWNLTTNWTGNSLPTDEDSVVFDEGFSGNITNVATTTIGALTVTGNSSVTLVYSGGGPQRKLTIANENTNKNFDLVINKGSELIISGTNFEGLALATNADASIQGVLTIQAANTFYTGGGSSNTSVGEGGVINNQGELVSTNRNRLSFNSGSTYIHARNGGLIPEANWSDNSNCIISGVINQMPTGFDQAFGNLTWNCVNQIPFTLPSIPSFGGNLEKINGDFSIISTGTGSVYLSNTATFHAIIAGDFNQSGGTLIINQTSGSGSMAIEGSFNMSGGLLSTNGGESSIFFSGSNGILQKFNKTGGVFSGNLKFEVASSSTIDFGTSILNAPAASFTLNSGAKIITANENGLFSAGAMGSIQTAIRVFSIGADYEFQGANTGVFNTGSSTNTTPSIVSNLTINNSSGPVNLSKPITINNAGQGIERLYLKSGALITTETNILTLNNGVVATGVAALNPNQYSDESFIDGPVRKIGNEAFVFPVGKLGFGLHRVGITAPVGGSNNSTVFKAQYFRANPQLLGNTLGEGLVTLSRCEYWTLERDGTNRPQVRLSWAESSGCGGQQYVTDVTTLRVAHLTGDTWTDQGNNVPSFTGNYVAGTITSNPPPNPPLDGVANFGVFALASSSSASNPLPVIFANVWAVQKGDGVEIGWSNLTEKDVLRYTVEKSTDGQNFHSIAERPAISNENEKTDYSAIDEVPANGINYYRIKAEELGGKSIYTKVLRVNLKNTSLALELYPNPVDGHKVTLNLSNLKRSQYYLKVVGASGKDLFRQTINSFGNKITQVIDLPTSLKSGVYFMVITGEGYSQSKMFIIQ